MVYKGLGLFLVVAMICVFLCPAYASGVGVAPAEVHFSGVLRGGYAQVAITLSNPNDVPTVVSISPSGPTKPYLIFLSSVVYQGPYAFERVQVSNITLLPKSTAQIWVAAKPGIDLPIGNYTGAITFYAKPMSMDVINTNFGTGISVAVEIPAYLEVTGDQKLSFDVNGISAKDAEIGYPIQFIVSGTNSGNVRAAPQVNIKVMDRDRKKTLKEVRFNGTEYLPTVTQDDTFNISSDNMTEGQYWANVSVYLGGKAIKTQLVTFDVLQQGALKRVGELVQINAKVWPHVGEIVRVDAVFQNTGEFPVDAKFSGEVSLNDTIVSVLDSEEVNVPVGSTINLTTYVTPNEPGRYVIKGSVYYSKKVTFEKEAILNVLPAQEMATSFSPDYVTIALVILAVALFIVLWRRSR